MPAGLRRAGTGVRLVIGMAIPPDAFAKGNSRLRLPEKIVKAPVNRELPIYRRQQGRKRRLAATARL
jgi:hypothetical protein